jgi:hypothetical protein
MVVIRYLVLLPQRAVGVVHQNHSQDQMAVLVAAGLITLLLAVLQVQAVKEMLAAQEVIILAVEAAVLEQ